MKICYLNYQGGPTIKAAENNLVGGLNTILFNLICQISLRPEVEAVAVYRDDGQMATLHGRKEVKLPAGPQTMLSRPELELYLSEFTVAVEKYLAIYRPDVVHTSGSEAGAVMSQLRIRGMAIPWIHTNYATVAVRRVMVDGQKSSQTSADLIGEREKQCLIDCDQVIALSESDKQEIAAVFPIPPGKIMVIEPGIDHKIFQPGLLTPRKKVIISAGRMSKIKDFPFLLSSFRILKQLNDTDSRLIIIGGNAFERRLLGLPQLADELGISDSLSFVDGVGQDALAAYFRQAKVFAAHSQHETFGLLPIEARACGTPFVARANSGYLTAGQDGGGGYFCANDSERDMADKILRIVNMEEDDWAALSQKAIASAQAYEWSDTAEKSLFIYQQVIKNQGGMKINKTG
ncbi:MAG: glycosyltransferase [Patescibacteria group bacterium]